MDGLLEKIDIQDLLTRLVEFLPSLGAAILILILAWLLFRLTRGSLSRMLERAGFEPALVKMLISNIYRFVLMIFGLVMAAGQIGINVGAALAGIGVAGIAIGFAAQDSLANTLAGFMIFWDKPFQVGDWINVADEYGEVAEITMRSTRMRTPNNTYVVIPNKSIIDQVLVNHSKHGETRVDVPIGIAYKEDIPTAREVLLAAVKGFEDVSAVRPTEVVVAKLSSSSVDMQLRVWIDDAAIEKAVYARVMEAGKLALDHAGIEIPYHHMQLFIDKVDDRVWEGVKKLAPLSALSGPANGQQGS
ncbi:mechanosensitive ion channel family protein [Candidatus Eisenbacteria bacterium]|uniref:Mechanosensitive ion channel family protein n=1 Tax=Eiseniibacteriota bacterium TaxID=2212470 RepID=A0ABV6YIY0_UNCEI